MVVTADRGAAVDFRIAIRAPLDSDARRAYSCGEGRFCQEIHSAGTGRLQVTVNGHPRVVASKCTISTLLDELRIRPKFCAVERNERLVPRTAHAQCRLQSGDRLEIVTLVGGG